jgi:hypothetical protein
MSMSLCTETSPVLLAHSWLIIGSKRRSFPARGTKNFRDGILQLGALSSFSLGNWPPLNITSSYAGLVHHIFYIVVF